MAKEEKIQAGSVELVPIGAELEAIAEVFAGMGETEVVLSDPQQVTRNIMLQILGSESEEDLWRELPTWSTKEFVGKGFKVLSADQIYPSKYTTDDGRKGAFLSAKAVNLETGEEGILNTSAIRVASKIIWLAKHDKLPRNLKIVKRGETQNGFEILDVEKLD